MNQFKPYIEAVDQAILDHFAKHAQPSTLKEVCLYALMSGGRRVRPLIALIAAKSLGCSLEKCLPFALAVEFFHTASLIADDLPCMDNDDVRRGKPSTHKKFGEAAAVLATYVLIAEGYGLLGRAPKKAVSQLLIEASKATGLLGASQGQLLDLSATFTRSLPSPLFNPKAQPFNEITKNPNSSSPIRSPSSFEEMIHKKTGSLFEFAFLCGWIAAGKGKEDLSLVRKTASHFGSAFQIFDDLEDVAQKSVNIVSEIGFDLAKNLFKDHLEAFKFSLKELQLEQSPLMNLSQFLEASPLRTCSKSLIG